MSEQLTLSAETRERAGKGASRAMRREGRVPAVIYGQKQDPISIHVEEKVLVKMLSTGHFMNSVVMIDVGGTATRTLPKDVQFHPVTDRPRSAITDRDFTIATIVPSSGMTGVSSDESAEAPESAEVPLVGEDQGDDA